MGPDPAAGVFDTVLVRAGRPRHLDRHVARLAASAHTLYGADVAEEATARARAAVADAAEADGRLRITAVPGGTGVEVAATVAPLGDAADPAAVTLAPLVVPGGLGAHKWLDRRRLERATAELGATPLLVDTGGEVLEAAWGNVWAREGDELVTPPADGRILPGVTRALLLARAGALGLRAVEAEVTLERLRTAAAIVVTSSLRLAVDAELAAAPARPGGVPLERLRAALEAESTPVSS